MTQQEALQEAQSTIGAKLSRKLFEIRGNHSEMHLSEVELSNIIDSAIQWADTTAVKYQKAVANGEL